MREQKPPIITGFRHHIFQNAEFDSGLCRCRYAIYVCACDFCFNTNFRFFFLRSRLDAHARRTHMHTRNFAVRGVYLCAVTSQMTKELR